MLYDGGEYREESERRPLEDPQNLGNNINS